MLVLSPVTHYRMIHGDASLTQETEVALFLAVNALSKGPDNVLLFSVERVSPL
jgi:hypothetical protein